MANNSSGEVYDRLRAQLYDQRQYLNMLASMPGVIDEFFKEKTREQSSRGYKDVFREEIRTLNEEINALSKYLSS